MRSISILMASFVRTLIFLSACFGWAQANLAQNSNQVRSTITEPGIFNLQALFESADAIALVKVISGDTESYETAVYKGEVLQNFKGVAVGETLYFGPYAGMRLGWEYILFLRQTKKPLSPNTTSSVNYGTIRYLEVFNEGYSSMETSYQCVFDGKEIAQQCDYGVRVCTDYIQVPNTFRVFPPKAVEVPFGCRWVRRKTFISWLETQRNLME